MKATFLVIVSLLAYITAFNQKKIVCYFGSWAVYRPGNGNFNISEFDSTLCTHLIYAFIGLNEDEGIKILDPFADLPDDGGKDGFNKFVQLRTQSPSTKFLIGIGGWNEGSTKYSQLVASSEKRTIFVDEAVNFVKKYHFDGLDFDWEYPNQRGGVEADRKNFVLLLKELRERFDKENLLLTVAVGASEATTKLSYVVPEVVKYVDFMNLMTYDYHGFVDGKTGMNAPLFPAYFEQGEERLLNVYSSVNHWISQGAPPRKIVMGIPFYGKTFTLSNVTNRAIGAPAKLPGHPGPSTQEAGTLGYNEICEMQMKENWDIHFERMQQVPYAVKGDQWISYDNPWSVKKKADLIKKLKLGGAMVWSIETDDFRGICGNTYALLKILNSVLRSF